MKRIFAATLAAMVLFSCTKPSPAVPDETTPPQEPLHKVGEYYSDALVKGVVIRVDDESGEHGLLISMKEGQKKWSTENVFLFYVFYAEGKCFSRSDGAVNGMLIRGLDGWADNYPAFAWCSKLNLGNSNAWYMPSLGEGDAIAAAYSMYKDEINAALADNGGTELSDGRYWSSEEATSSQAYVFELGRREASEEYGASSKQSELKVRAVRKF